MRRYFQQMKPKEIGIISIILIVIFSFTLFFLLQQLYENDIRDTLFEQHKEHQMESTIKISENIESDLNRVLNLLDGLSNSIYLQNEDFYSKNAQNFIRQKYESFNDIINRLFILDSEDIVSLSLAERGLEKLLGNDLSMREWVINTKNVQKPTFSVGFELQGIYRIFISYPIINIESGKYLGMLVASVPTVPFFSHYANVQDVNSSFLIVYNKNGTFLANGVSNSFIGMNFYDTEVQEFINHDPKLFNLTNKLLKGESGFAVYDYGKGERLTTQIPVTIGDQNIFFIQLVTPTKIIYSLINEALLSNMVKSLLLFTSTLIAIVVLVIFLLKWNNMLNKEVKRRTIELDKSNKQLQSLNETLQLHERMQKEFINIAAHELRTPIQPILGLTQILQSKIGKRNSQISFHLDIIIRNAKRLSRLSENILDVTRIESQLLILNKEKVIFSDFLDLVKEIVTQFQNINENKINIEYEDCKNELKDTKSLETISVNIDKCRIVQVISNLLDNSTKFTKSGEIQIQLYCEQDFLKLIVKDDGEGINQEIMPRLFTKFASRSFNGTGLGLFITKSIVEAHGGKIWAENSYDGKGAMFIFSLPIDKQSVKDLQ